MSTWTAWRPTHDRIVEHAGVFAKAVAGIQAAVREGFQVCTNTTIYRQTDMQEVAVLYEYLTQLGVGRDDDFARLRL